MFASTLRKWLRESTSARPARATRRRWTIRLVVEPLEELVMLSSFTVMDTSDNAADTNSLRYAIDNLSAGTNTIHFAIPGSGVHTIHLLTPLPIIAYSVFIDGSTQTGYAGSPLIQIDGSAAGSTFTDGLYITAGNSTVKGLDITGFTGTAIVLDSGGANVIENNYIGTDATGTAAAGNVGGGLAIYGSPSNQIVQNVISGNSFTSGSPNGSAGVYVTNAGANGNIFTGDFIGTNATGTTALGNGGVGIYIAGGAQNTRIGTDGDGVNDIAERNIISGNSYDGIVIQGTSSGANTAGTVVAGNYIGTSAAGTAALPNGSDGMLIDGGAQNSRIGVNGSDTAAAAEQNVISGNTGQGIALSDTGTSSNVVAGNFIGTNAAGTAALPNYYGGIDILNGASSNRIGFDGTSSAAVAALERNVISGNGSIPGEAGIYVADVGTNLNVIAGNYIGVDASGGIAMANSGSGVFLDIGAENNRIGSDGNGVMDASKANVISGNAYEGVTIRGTSSGANTTGNIVAGNFIGTNAAGTSVLGNKSYGIWIINRAQFNRVGTNGTDADPAGEGNVIAGNGRYMPDNNDFRSGVAISDPGSNSNMVAGNWIGTNTTGVASLPNADSGVHIFNGAQNNQIGGSAALANVIAYNTQAGVAVTDTATTGNSIRFNKIYSNGGLGIDLGDSGVQVNHAGATSGPNNLQNYPLITSATPGSTTVIQGVLNSLPSTTYTIDFYADSTTDITFYGPGQRYLGAISVSTNSSGTATFAASLSAMTSTGDWVTATATDPSGDTSEFSGDRQLPYATPALSTSTWTQLGPYAIAQSPEFSGPVMAGRIETAAADPTNANVMYLTADGGGVWKTTNWLSTSPTWTPLTDAQSSTVTGSGDYAFTSLAVYPGNPSIIYAAAAGPGGGVLKSTDGGQSWKLLRSSVFDQAAFGSLVVDPGNPNTIYVTVLYGYNNNIYNVNLGGVYRSTDGGASWTNTTSSIHTGWASDIVMDPNDSQTLYAGLTQDTNTATNGLYKTTDGGQTWTHLAGGLPTGSAVGNSIRVAVAATSPNTVVLYATVFESADSLPHRFRSTDGGAVWTALPALPTNEEPRYWHIMLSVDPHNPQTIYVNGDHTVYQSTNGGSAWTLVNNFEDPVGGYFDDSGDLVLTGDHGIYRVTNVNSTIDFVNKQGNLSTSEFYTLTLDPNNANIAYGLVQDQFAVIKYMGYPTWNSTGQAPNGQGGEGVGEIGKILVDPTSPNKLYQYAPNDSFSFILSSTDGGATWTNAGTGIPTTLVGYALGYASQKAFVMDPTNSQRLLVGTDEVYETTNGSGSWSAISGVLSSGQYITALAIAPSSTNTVYAATSDGKIFIGQYNGATWTWTEKDSGLPQDFYDQIVSIQVDPSDASRAFIVPGRFPTNVVGAARVWETIDGGSTWTDITGNLPSEYWTNSIAVDWRPATPVLFVATARGVYQSADLGVHWSRFGESLPNSPVTDLQLLPGLNVLAAATYGRGAWEIQLGAINRVWTGGSGTSANWNDANNWAGNTVPVAGDNLIFPAGANRLTNANNLTAGAQFGNIVFQSGGYSVSGNAIDLNGTMDGSASSGNTAFNLAVTLTGASSVLTGGAGSAITLGQAINTNGFALSVDGGGEADFTGNISGGGGLSVAAGTVKLSGTNTFAGGTVVTAGMLIVLKASALRDGSNLTVGAASAFDPPAAAPIANVPAPAAASSPTRCAGAPAPRKQRSSAERKAALVSAARAADAVLLQMSGRQATVAAIARRSAGNLWWLAAEAVSLWSDNQGQKRAVSLQALDAVLAPYESR